MTEIIVEDGAGCSLDFLEHDGFRYPRFPAQYIRDLPELELLPDDVILCAYPKSGTHWLWEIVRQLLALQLQKEPGPLPLVEKDDGFLEMMSADHLRRLPSPRVLNTHLYFHKLPSQVLRQGCRLLRLVRDPRDVAVSYYHHHRKLTDLYHYDGDWHNYFPLYITGQLDYGSWFDYHLSWERGLTNHPHLKVLQLSYEGLIQAIKDDDIIDQGSGTYGSRARCGSVDGCIWLADMDPMAAVRRLAEFLQVAASEEQLQLVEIACRFDNMRLTKGHLETDRQGEAIMYRKGQVGDWKNQFTVAQAELMSRTYRARVQELLDAGATAGVPLAASYNMDS